MRLPAAQIVTPPRPGESDHAATPIPPPLRADVRRRLLRWFDRHRRDLPWRRRAGDAYAQWVAEIMLQQTRVDTVLERYEPFLRRFPTVTALANASFDDVLKHWEGLGYYRRIRHLHQAARVVRDDGGRIPTTAPKLRRLPGIGDYTAAAIASIASGRREAAVDGNVARVIARLCGVADDVLSPSGRRRIRALAEQLVPFKRPGDFNQAWMDLATAVCKPRSPDCPACPLRAVCVAAATGTTDRLPVRIDRTRVLDVTALVGVFVHARLLLLRRRPDTGLWAGLWELPTVELDADTRAAAARDADARIEIGAGTEVGAETHVCAHRSARVVRQLALRRLARRHGITLARPPEETATIVHRLTHRAFRFIVHVAPVRRVRRAGATRDPHTGVWLTRSDIENAAVSTAHRRILRAVEPALADLTAGHPNPAVAGAP